MLKYRQVDFTFSGIWRVFISGSSSAGKTYFARQLLQNNFINCERIYYYHPDIQETFPVDWENYLHIPICFQAGIPKENDLLSMPRNSCIVLDDLYTQACADRTVDYLFRVLSSKRNLHVVIMTQRYFAEGSNGLNIRNSCNYHVLMNNADERTNHRVANLMGCKNSIKKGIEINYQKPYPYIFLDKTNQARVSGVQVYTELFGKFPQVVVDSMVSYLISESDFKAHFQKIDNNTAVKYEDQEKKLQSTSTESKPEKEKSSNSTGSPTGSRIGKGIGSPDGYSDRESTGPSSQSKVGARKQRFHQRKHFARQVERIIHRYNLKTKL